MTKTVLTITPNPALDLSGTVENIKPNEKAYVLDEQRNPGGNAINCARILNRLGVHVVATGFLGGGTGKEISDLLDGEKLKHQFISISQDTRINVTVSNRADHQQTRLSFPGPHIQPREKAKLLNFISHYRTLSLLVIGGSLPRGFTSRDITKIIKAGEKRGIATIVDCPGAVLKRVIKAKPLLIKPNLEEFQALTESKCRTRRDVIKKAQTLLPYVQYICVSSVEGGALLVTKKGSYFGKIPAIKIRSTVGAGDSMVGAMVAELNKGNTSEEDLLRWGLAAAAATLQESGTTLGQASAIKSLYKKIKVVQV